ncbi:uncharacterized protein MELLADRAFT_102672 [Melampsora larici-populina 98AG31]|uniref:DUF7143 domain-containing protein n=1 Tax=Melampsora larici-populina (strain 98AG31 / pathotype 3-4-7) TaxID=747676 RepID=F4R909_MELLP|nr:uncharacterized protein MELLADRAFT_102672 [Melampsora larici-populina 98AG31]EGG10904.1 hypothetical protein MELLADRAFT_102672 [Melampsora larici-populina 98AG31]
MKCRSSWFGCCKIGICYDRQLPNLGRTLAGCQGSTTRLVHAKDKKVTNDNLCFLLGKTPVPSDVKPDPGVKCIPNSQAFPSLKQLPDVEFGEGKFLTRFTTISFLKDTKVSSVRFGIKNFPLSLDREALNSAFQVYEAMNAGLRSLGETPKGKILRSLKGTTFFLKFQLRCKDKDVTSPQGAKHQMLKVLKNCVGCTADDKAEVKKLAAACGITDFSKP